MAFKDSLPKKVVAQLEWVKGFIVEHPKQFAMQDWCASTECGTTGCIAGWMYMGSLKRLPARYSDTLLTRTASYAHKLMDVHPALSRLFHLHAWPDRFTTQGDDWTNTTPELAVKRIDYFLEHGE